MVPLFQVPEGTIIDPRSDMNHIALRLESGTYEEVKEYLERNGLDRGLQGIIVPHINTREEAAGRGIKALEIAIERRRVSVQQPAW